eukprot:5476523-Amphidinium_carterae.1
MGRSENAHGQAIHLSNPERNVDGHPSVQRSEHCKRAAPAGLPGSSVTAGAALPTSLGAKAPSEWPAK